MRQYARKDILNLWSVFWYCRAVQPRLAPAAAVSALLRPSLGMLARAPPWDDRRGVDGGGRGRGPSRWTWRLGSHARLVGPPWALFDGHTQMRNSYLKTKNDEMIRDSKTVKSVHLSACIHLVHKARSFKFKCRLSSCEIYILNPTTCHLHVITGSRHRRSSNDVRISFWADWYRMHSSFLCLAHQFTWATDLQLRKIHYENQRDTVRYLYALKSASNRSSQVLCALIRLKSNWLNCMLV